MRRIHSLSRSPTSDTHLDHTRPTKRSCVDHSQTSPLSGEDDYDDLPALESIPSSPGELLQLPPPTKPSAYADAVSHAINTLSGPADAAASNDDAAPMALDVHHSVGNSDPAPMALDVHPGVANVPSSVVAHQLITEPADTAATLDGPIPNDTHNDFEGLENVDAADLDRALTFANKFDPDNTRYAVGKVPLTATWGSSPQTEKLLCIEDRPVTVWLVRKVRTTWFFNAEGQPQARVNVGFTLPHNGDSDGVKRLLQRARPRRDEVPSTIYASRFQSRPQKGSTEATIVPFKNIYDAQTRFRTKNEMPLLPASYIGRNDLVLVEAYFNRWKTAKDKKNRKAWTLWDVGFELQCISLLTESTVTSDDDQPLPNADVDDDM